MKEFSGIEYLGGDGLTDECLEALAGLLQLEEKVTNCRLLSFNGGHSFLLSVGMSRQIAIKSGFSSGYRGSGPAGLASALLMLERHHVEVEEVNVSSVIMSRIESSSLLRADIEEIESASSRRPRWREYVHETPWSRHGDWYQSRQYTQDYPLEIPLRIVHQRLHDLAVVFFNDPDSALSKGFRRLETQIRKKSSVEGEGVRLISKAFHGETPVLVWKDTEEFGEQKGRAQLFTGAFMALRNPLSHCEGHGASMSAESALSQFMVLSYLFELEDMALTPAQKDIESNQPSIDDLIDSIKG